MRPRTFGFAFLAQRHRLAEVFRGHVDIGRRALPYYDHEQRVQTGRRVVRRLHNVEPQEAVFDDAREELFDPLDFSLPKVLTM